MASTSTNFNNNNNNNNDLLTDPTKQLFPVKYYISINILLTLILYKTLLLIIVTKTILQFTKPKTSYCNRSLAMSIR